MLRGQPADDVTSSVIEFERTSFQTSSLWFTVKYTVSTLFDGPVMNVKSRV